jgi:radical SAM superfamily enzyme YgiQ (UPF0313 family)
VSALLEELDLEEVLSRVTDSSSDLIGIFFSMQERASDGQIFVERLRERGVKSHITVGGHFATFEARNILLHISGIDSVVRGEGEHTIVELVHRIESGKPLHGVRGLTFRHDGEIIENETRPNIENLDTLPFPARDTLSPVIESGDRVAISAQRGCYGRCTYCSIRSFYGKPGVRRRSPENVVDEIESLMASYGARRFSFVDDEFADRSARSRKWVRELCAEIEARGLNINFFAQLRPSDCVEEILAPLKKVGLRELFIGVESISQNALDHFDKQVQKSDVLKAIALADSLGLRLAIGFIMFEPDATIDDLRENSQWLRHHRDALPTHYFSSALPFSGTPLRRQLLRDGRLIAKSWHDIGTYRFRDPRVGAVFDAMQSLRPQIMEMHDLVNEGTVLYQRAVAQLMRLSSDDRAKCRDAIRVLRDAGRTKREMEQTVMIDIFEHLLIEAETDGKGFIEEKVIDASVKKLAQTVDSFRSARGSIQRAFAFIEAQGADTSL